MEERTQQMECEKGSASLKMEEKGCEPVNGVAWKLTKGEESDSPLKSPEGMQPPDTLILAE